jgi:hypothetical protein
VLSGVFTGLLSSNDLFFPFYGRSFAFFESFSFFSHHNLPSLIYLAPSLC